MAEPIPASPIATVLGGLNIPALPDGAVPKDLFALVKYEDGDGDEAWCIRVTSSLPDDELLGVLTGYVHHLKEVAAAEWADRGATSV